MNVFERFVDRHPEIKWRMQDLSRNPPITPEFIERHLDWDWGYV